jgi:hypothetical protein
MIRLRIRSLVVTGAIVLPLALLRADGTTPHSRSCKPTAPMSLQLRPPVVVGAAWQLRIEGLETIPGVEVSTWVRTKRGDGRPVRVWQGGMRRGEIRRLDLNLDVPADAIEVCAEAEVQTGSSSTVRALATAAVGEGIAVRAQLLSAGRTLQDGDGGTVLEFTGREAGSR